MPLARPTLRELSDRIHDDFNSRLPGADSRLRRNMLDVLAKTWAGALHALYGYVDYIAKQLFVDTAEGDYLARHAAIWGEDRKAAIKAQLPLTMTGTAATVCPANTRLQAADGTQYRVAADSSIDDPVTVIAAIGGTAGNLAIGVQLAFVSPVLGIDTVATVSGDPIRLGADEENDDLLRARVLARIRQTPQGGSLADYLQWALEVPEVTRVWVIPAHDGAGSVGVAFTMDGRVSQIPLSGDVAAVDAYLEARRPVTANVVTFAPTAVPIDIAITITPSNAVVKAAVAAELADYFRRDPQLGTDVRRSRLIEAISLAKGEVYHSLDTPSADVTITADEIAVLGTLTWNN